MATSAQFASVPRAGFGQTATSVDANGRAGSAAAGIVDVITGAAGGTRLERVIAQHAGDGSQTAVTLLFFVHDGANRRLVAERAALLTNNLATAGQVGGTHVITELAGLILPSAAWQLQFGYRGATAAANNWCCFAYGGDL